MILKTKRGYQLLTVASVLQKSIRRGDYKTAGFMALELFPKYTNYAWKRLLTVSAEDCAGIITKEIISLKEAFDFINKGKKADDKKGRIFLSKAVLVLCEAKHNRDADILQNFVYDREWTMDIDKLEKELAKETEKIEVPDYAYDCHTLKGKRDGKTKKDFFKEEQESMVNQTPSLFDISEMKKVRI